MNQIEIDKVMFRAIIKYIRLILGVIILEYSHLFARVLYVFNGVCEH